MARRVFNSLIATIGLILAVSQASFSQEKASGKLKDGLTNPQKRPRHSGRS